MPGKVIEFVFKGSNRSAIRALTEISTQSDRTSRKLSENNRKTSGTFKQVGDSAHRVRGAVSGLAATVGAGGLAFGIGSVVKAGMEWQKQQAQLRGALQATGQMSASTMEQLTKAAEGASSHGGFGAAENVQALTQFVTATKSAARAQRDLGLATDISRRTGKDFSVTTRALMMLENGRTTGLARMGLAVPKVTKAVDALRASHAKLSPAMLNAAKAQDAVSAKQSAFAALQARFGGATAAFSKTTAGHLSNLRNSWKNLQEQLGAGLLPVVNKVVGAAAVLFGWLNKHKVVLYALLGTIGAVTAVLTTHAIITELVKTKTILLSGAQRLLGISAGEAAAGEEGATVATTLFGAAMDALPIIAIVAGLILLATHFDTVKRVAGVAWKWIKTAAQDTFKWIKSNWPLLAGIILAPFTLGISLVIGLFHKQLLSGIKTAVGVIGRVFKGLFSAITWPFREAWKIIKKIANAIVGAFNWVVDKVKSVFHFITSIPGKIGHAAGSLLHTATFGLLHGGGEVKPKYMAVGGPVGSDTIPGWLSPGEYVLNRQMTAQAGVGALDRWKHGGSAPGGGSPEVIELHHTTQLDSRRIAESVVRYQIGRAARGPSSLVGGPMQTGSR